MSGKLSVGAKRTPRSVDKSEYDRAYDKFMDENYPRLQPCMQCDYWRTIKGGVLYNGTFVNVDPACYYFLITGELRGECQVMDGFCDKFKPRSKGGKK